MDTAHQKQGGGRVGGGSSTFLIYTTLIVQVSFNDLLMDNGEAIYRFLIEDIDR